MLSSTPLRLSGDDEVVQPTLFQVDIVAEGNRFRLEEPSGTPAEVEFRCHVGTLALIMYGRLAVSDAVSQGKVVLKGDSGLALRTVRTLCGRCWPA
jgi:hypothetical protein